MNDSENSEKYILLKQELKPYLNIFEITYKKVLEKGNTKHPILVLHQDIISIGVPLIQKKEVGGNWNINVSRLEEFITSGLIRSERVEEFQTLYERKKENYCLFVLSDLGANFVFIPRIKDALGK